MIDANAATNEQIFWIIATAYIGRTVGMLDKTMENKLDSLFQGKAQSWPEQVEHALGIDQSFVQGVFDLCIRRNSPTAAIGFLLRGLGCPPGDVDARIRELSVQLAP